MAPIAFESADTSSVDREGKTVGQLRRGAHRRWVVTGKEAVQEALSGSTRASS